MSDGNRDADDPGMACCGGLRSHAPSCPIRKKIQQRFDAALAAQAEQVSSRDNLSTLLAELDAAVAKMTPGPWFVSGPFPNASIYEGCISDYDRYDPDSGQLPPKWIAQGAYRCAKNIAEDHDIEGIVALVNAYPALKEGIAQLQRRVFEAEFQRQVFEDQLNRKLDYIREKEGAQCRGEWPCAAGITLAAWEPAIRHFEEVEKERDQLSEIIDTWGFAWMKEREYWRELVERGDLIAIRCTQHYAVPVQNRNEHSGGECGGCIAEDRDTATKQCLDLLTEKQADSWHQGWRQAVRERDEARRECDEARARAIRWNNEHAAAEDRWVEERDALRALVEKQRGALRGVIAIVESKAIRGLAAFAFVHGYKPCSDEETERNIKTLDEARAVLAAEVPGG